MIMTNREIGSEFWNVPVSAEENGIFPSDVFWFVSGRGALTAIIEDIKKKSSFKKVAVPSWCCDSMILPFINGGVQVEFYSVIAENGELRYDFSGIGECDALLTMDFFGYVRNRKPDFDGIVINDITHSVFAAWPQYGDYIFGSLRKWAGFYTGGFAFSKNGEIGAISKDCDKEYIELRRLAMEKKEAFISFKTDSKKYLEIFARAEDILDEYSFGAGCSEDIFRAKQADAAFIKSRRRENAQCLLKRLDKYAVFPEIRDEDCPLFVPIMVPEGKRDALRRHLVEQRIYCPVHWPLTEFHNIRERDKDIYKSELSVVCDQRYIPSDMEIICSEIVKFLD